MFKSKKIVLKTIFCFSLIGLFVIGSLNVSASTTVANYSYSANIAGAGHKFLTLDHISGTPAQYVKVVINTANGDKYDVRYVYTTTYPSERSIIAQKTGITAKGTTTTLYFIPSNGSCPGSSSQCITVPTISHYTNSNYAALNDWYANYGIEIYNGSWLGGALSVNGTYSFINY